MNDTEESYRKEWATLTGRAESDIYIPTALREAGASSSELRSRREDIREDDEDE